jgi:KDO2-lipid IV(A) lauroyltransferase
MDSRNTLGRAIARWKHKPLRGLWRRTVFLCMRWLMRRCGFDGARTVGLWFGALHYRFGAGTRQRCMAGLALLLGRDKADPEVASTLREAYRVNSIAVLEVLSMLDRRLAPEMLRQRCRVEGVAFLEAARAGRGAIMLATHSGNSLLLAAQLADAGWPVSVVYRHTRMMTQEFFQKGFPSYGIEGILANEGFRAYASMLDALRRNRILFAMVDQGVENEESGLNLRFLGKIMPMPAGVAQLARHSRSPILPIVTLAADPVWHFAIGPRLLLPAGGSLDEHAAIILQDMEREICARPQLWSWPHRRWRNFPLADSA